MSIENTLAERGNRYGDFTDHARLCQDLKDVMTTFAVVQNTPNSVAVHFPWGELPATHKQALEVIADKIARILSGDPNYADNWHDIQGYAKLVEDRLPKTEQQEHTDTLAQFDERRDAIRGGSGGGIHTVVLPDGSAFGVVSFPLSKDHWLYADRAYEDGADQPKELPAPILSHGSRETVVAAARYAVRGATNCGKEPDFDPDALVQNVVYALCGPYGGAFIQPQSSIDPADVEPASAIDDSSDRMQAIGQNGNDGEHYDDPWAGAPEWAKHAVMQSDGKWCYYEFRPARIAADIISR